VDLPLPADGRLATLFVIRAMSGDVPDFAHREQQAS
jgi:hypothetical protein